MEQGHSMCVCWLCMCMHCVHVWYVCVHVCVHVCEHACVHVCVHAYAWCTCTCKRVQACVHGTCVHVGVGENVQIMKTNSSVVGVDIHGIQKLVLLYVSVTLLA